ncbi:hypothetical protein [Halobacteriovorax sp. ZH2_bin.1]|uniref:hypothetical protein n=1 Tax=unclassified Halobacteriovorax TaxID=2639665 RepID=UPI0037103A2A
MSLFRISFVVFFLAAVFMNISARAYDYNDINQRITVSNLDIKSKNLKESYVWGGLAGLLAYFAAPEPTKNKVLNGFIGFSLGFGGKLIYDNYTNDKPTIMDDFNEQRKRDLFNGI